MIFISTIVITLMILIYIIITLASQFKIAFQIVSARSS